MKNAKQYSQKVQKLYRSLKRKYGKVKAPQFKDPVDAVVYAVLCESLPLSQTDSAMKKLQNHFIDWNDLRVSRSDEIVETIGKDNPSTRQAAANLTKSLYAVFGKYNTLSIDEASQGGKKQARQNIEK